MRRSFGIALLLSALIHLLVLAAPGWQIGSLFEEDAPLIEAHLVAPAAKPVLAPEKKSPPRKTVREAQATPLPDNPKPVPEEIAAAETSAEAVSSDANAAEEKKEAAVADAATEPEPAAIVPEVVPLLPRTGRIHYAITRGQGGFVVGQSVYEWRHDGKHYLLNATSQTTGIAAIFKPVKVTQTSEGSFVKGELKPDSFRFDRGGNDIATANFDWRSQQVTLGDGQVVAIADGAEDFLSMFYQLTQAAQRGEGFIMAVATGKKVERYAFEWLGEEEVTLKPGRFHTWHVRIRAATGGKDTTEVWLGKEVASLPIKIRFTDRKGDVSEQVAEEIDYEGK